MLSRVRQIALMALLLGLTAILLWDLMSVENPFDPDRGRDWWDQATPGYSIASLADYVERQDDGTAILREWHSLGVGLAARGIAAGEVRELVLPDDLESIAIMPPPADEPEDEGPSFVDDLLGREIAVDPEDAEEPVPWAVRPAYVFRLVGGNITYETYDAVLDPEMLEQFALEGRLIEYPREVYAVRPDQPEDRMAVFRDESAEVLLVVPFSLLDGWESR